MNITKTHIEGLIIIEPRVFEDDRGFFYESWNAQTQQANGLDYNWVQDNHAKSSYGVVRGLHYQCNPMAQAKLVRVSKGAVVDVAVDLRKNSPTYGDHVSILLSAENKKQFLVPRGFAHGYAVVSKTAEFLYKCDNFYSKEDEGGIHPTNNGLKIDWGLKKELMILSEKDQKAPDFENCINNFE